MALHKLTRFLLFLTIPGLAFPSILPETIGAWQRGPTAMASVPDPQVWAEYGLQDSETAQYAANGKSYSISAYRFADATGAFAAFDEARPADAKPIVVTDVGAENAAEELVSVGNYLFIYNGYKPNPEELNHVVGTVPKYAQSPLPTLQKHLPPGAEPNSERYITGPRSLARFTPSIPPSIAAFHYSAEAATARYGPAGKDTLLIVFSYPTMEMAKDRLKYFQQVGGALVKRTGPLLAITLNATNPDMAERLLAQVRFQADVTVPEHVPTVKDNPINLFWNILILCLVLAGFCLVSGLMVGGLRLLLRRAGASGEGDAMISLRLSGRP